MSMPSLWGNAVTTFQLRSHDTGRLYFLGLYVYDPRESFQGYVPQRFDLWEDHYT